MATTTRENLETVLGLEEAAQRDRGIADRIADAISRFVGSLYFVVAQVLFVLAWLALDGRVPPLALMVSVESVLLTAFVLMSQNRMARRADQRDHLNLQIDLLAEKELTKLLQLQRLVCEKLGIPEGGHEEELDHLSEETAVEHMADELAARLPNA